MILRKLSYLTIFLVYSTNVLTTYYYGCPLFLPLYGAQNEAYMSRSAEKWVRGLCFNELGVCG